MNNGGIEMAAKSNPHVSVPQWQQQTRWTQVTPLLQQNSDSSNSPFCHVSCIKGWKAKKTHLIHYGWLTAKAHPNICLPIKIPNCPHSCPDTFTHGRIQYYYPIPLNKNNAVKARHFGATSRREDQNIYSGNTWAGAGFCIKRSATQASRWRKD